MEFTPDHFEILFRARMLGTDRGQVLDAWLYPEAHALTEQGWLRRQFEQNGDVSWWLTPEGDTSLDLASLTQCVEGREN